MNSNEEALHYGVNERTIQRDIDDIRSFLEERDSDNTEYNTVIYDRAAKGFRLEYVHRMKLSNSEVLAICKILLDSRAFTKKEMKDILGRLIENCVPKSNQKLVSDLIENESFHYIEPRHKKEYIDTMWSIGEAIRDRHLIEIEYTRQKDRKTVVRVVKPLAIMFSEFYFYLTAFIDDEKVQKDFDVLNDSFPTIYRMGELFEHWDSGPDEELREQGRAEERKNTEAESRADAEQQRADVAENRAEKAESREDAVEVESAKLREEIARLKATRG